MSDRLKGLLADIRFSLVDEGRALVVSGQLDEALTAWARSLEAEIAEREAPPPVLEEGLAKVAKQLESVGAFFHTVIYKPGGEPVEATVTVNTAAGALRTLALRGARPATRAEWLAIAADLAQDEGEVTEGLARAVAAMLPRLVEHESVRGALVKRVVGPWSFVRTEDPYEDWRRHSADGDYVADAAESDGQEDGQEGVFWRVWDRNRLVTHGHAPTIREAMLAADAALRAKGRILLGGLPDEVAAPAVTYELSVNTKPLTEALEQTGERIRRFIGADVGASQDGAFIVVEQDQLDRMRMVGRVSDERATATVDEDDPQPDASWLRLMGRDDRLLGVQTWRYQGSTEDARPLMLIDWLEARRLLYSSSGSADEGMHQIVTRAPLDLGAREAP